MFCLWIPGESSKGRCELVYLDVPSVEIREPQEGLKLLLGLEHCQCVDEAKQHDKLLVVTSRCSKCRLPYVPLSDAHKVLGNAQIKFGENVGSLVEFESSRQ